MNPKLNKSIFSLINTMILNIIHFFCKTYILIKEFKCFLFTNICRVQKTEGGLWFNISYTIGYKYFIITNSVI